jgi:EmrB/QacA subfamily drug resistance transporter
MTDAVATRVRSRWTALVVLCTGMLMIILDSTIVNVALPSIQSDLGFSQSSLAWVVNAYLIPFGGLLLLAGRLGDLTGRRRMFLMGLGVFTVASLVCGIAQSQEVLIGARFVQGVGGAMASAVILGMIVTMFPEPRERATAIGIYSFVASAGASIGLLAGGVLTQAISWHWIFFVNLPIGIATAAVALRLIERDAGIGFGRGADIAGAVLVTAALMLGVYSIVEAADYGWASLHTLGLGAVSLALLGSFLVRQARISEPLMPLRIFRSRNVSGANLIQMLMVAGLFGMFFLGVLYLERVLG